MTVIVVTVMAGAALLVLWEEYRTLMWRYRRACKLLTRWYALRPEPGEKYQRLFERTEKFLGSGGIE